MFLLRDTAFRALFIQTWPLHCTCAKDNRLFYLNYPPVNEVGKSDQMVMKEQFVSGQQMETIDFYHGKEAPLQFDQTQNTPLERANQN